MLGQTAPLQAFLASSGKKETLFQYLPEKIAAQIAGEEVVNPPDFVKFLSPETWLNGVHFSWFKAPLESISPESQPLFLSLLELSKRKKVAHLMGISFSPPQYAAFMRPFLMDELKKKVFEGLSILPFELLPSCDLNALFSITYKQLLTLIDLLGVYDLSNDMRQVVSKELLHKVHTALTPEQLRFLQVVSKQSIKWISPKLELFSWDGKEKTLQKLLHSRGLSRLGRGLFNEEQSFKWHFLHRLDIGRAAVIEKVMRQPQEKALTPYFKDQILSITKRYQE